MRKPTVHRRSEGLCRTDSHMCARNTNTPKQVKNRIRTPNIHTHFHKHCNPSNNTLLHGPTDCVCCLRVGSVVDPPQGFGCSVITHNHCHTLRFDCECMCVASLVHTCQDQASSGSSGICSTPEIDTFFK